jgi:hypothetical protein
MSFCCVLCQQQTLFISSLCGECQKVKYLMMIYSPEKVVDVLNRVLKVKNVEKRIVNVKEEERDA